MPERPCTLTGTPGAIMMCKQAMQQIIDRGQGLPHMGGMDGMGEGSTVVEINIPGTKVGLIIGKGGETIRQLQERAQVKMVMIQDSNAPSAHDKPLRITGEPSKCQRAKEMVLDLLAEKDGMPRSGGGGGYNDFGSPMSPMGHGGGSSGMDIGVPRQGVGLVIGKGGDMIKKIQSDTGAKVQFKPDDGQSQDRVCSITGPSDKVESAVLMIQDLLAKANIMGGQPVQSYGGPMGSGPSNDMGRGGPGNGPFSPQAPGRGGMGGRFDSNFQDITTFNVPADKCGLVIGKGGETIREINRQSGAHVELDRNPPPNLNEKLFNIRGNPGQIQHAIQLIQEKTGQQGGLNDQMRMGPGGGPSGMMGGPGGPNGPPGGHGPQGGPSGPGPQSQGYDQFGGHFGQPNQQPQQQYGGAPQTWNAYGNQYPQQNITNKQPSDVNAAQWAAYYYATYGQGQPGQQPAAQHQPAAPQPQPMPQQQPTQTNYAQPSELRINHTINPVTGQPDYSQAWIEYYRAQNMPNEAQMVIQQVQSQAAAQGGQQCQP
uniref:K Homology domain-containing protein n=3 Tax=Arion vulgaris TaxID=1028688 RepID=A0A0B6ZGD1_9EUPU